MKPNILFAISRPTVTSLARMHLLISNTNHRHRREGVRRWQLNETQFEGEFEQ
jgi:hypothetical protein